MSDNLGDSISDGMPGDAQRLHPLSWVFYFASLTPKILFPLLGFLVMGRRQDQWALSGLIIITPIYLWVALRAWLYRYQISADELLIRDGVLDRTLRHIPLARIQHVSQKRKLLHRILGVTELRLESASGKKPEAVMKVLSNAAAIELEAILRGHHTAPAPDAQSDLPPNRVLHQLPLAEILRLGLISNRGTVITIFLFGTIMQKDGLRDIFLRRISTLSQSVLHLVTDQVALHHYARLTLGVLVALIGLFIVLRLLSVILALLRYKGFVLELEGERLLAQHGLGTEVRTSARLPRLQRWLLEETWLHQRFGRCRLAVTSVGSHHHDQHNKFGADANFTELAPIATRTQALALLQVCLPGLNWDALEWQSLPGAAKRRLLGQVRWLLLAVPALLWANQAWSWFLPWPLLLMGVGLLLAAMVAHALAWQAFAGYAESDDILIYRSGVFHKRWVIVATSHLQALRLSSAPIDQRLGLQTLHADTQGGSRRKRALHIPYLSQGAAQALRARIWQRLHTSAK